MTEYDLMLVMSSGIAGDDKKKMTAVATKLLGDTATITEVVPLGKKKLAYPILKQSEAAYCRVHFSTPNLQMNEIEKKSKMGNDIVRYLITRTN